MQETFDIRWNADRRAIKRWQAANPGNDLTWPDHVDLVLWLMGQIDLIERQQRVDSALAKQLSESMARNAALTAELAALKRAP